MIPNSELKFDYARSGGPGGQNVNKVETKARLHWNFLKSKTVSKYQKTLIMRHLSHRIVDDEIIIESQRHRSRAANIKDAKEKLFALLDSALKPLEKRKPTKPSVKVQEKRLETKKIRSKKKQLRRKVA